MSAGPTPERQKRVTTPVDVRLFLFIDGCGFAAWVVLYHIFAGAHLSALFFPTRQRRVVFSVVFVLVFAAFWIYLHTRKPSWLGWHGAKEKLEKPKTRHWVYLATALLFIWVSAFPGLLPTDDKTVGGPFLAQEHTPVAPGTSESTLGVAKAHAEDRRISVLVAQFAGCSSSEYGVAQILKDEIEKALIPNTDVKIELLETAITSRETARSEARSRAAPIVVWGSCFANKERARVTAHFEILPDFRYSSFLYQEHSIDRHIAELEYFTIQDQLSKDMSFLVLLTLGLMRLDAGDYDAAVTRLDQALTETHQPVNQGAVLFYRGIAYLGKREFQLAASDFTKASMVDAFELQSWHNLGLAYVNQGKYQESIKAYSKSLDFLKTKRTVISRYWDIATADSRVPTFHNLGHVYYMIGNYQQALSNFIEDTRVHPGDAKGYFFQAVAYERLKQPEQVIHYCSVALEKDPNHDNAYHDEAYHLRGHAHLKLGHLDQAIDDFAQATSLSPGFAECHFDRAVALEMDGNPVAAMFEFYESIKASGKPDLRQMAWRHLNHQHYHHLFDSIVSHLDVKGSKSPVVSS